MKLQKYLSQAGICSRRKGEEYIERGLVFVNDIVAHIGQVIDPEVDKVRIGDEIVKEQSELVYYVYNKPRDIVTTCLSGQEGEKGIMDVIDIPERVFPVGRLDKETTGLILLTNDGRLSNYLIHPRYEHEKEYMVEVYGKIEDEALEQMSRGVKIELKENGSRTRKVNRNTETESPMKLYKTRPCEIERLSSSKFTIILREGKNRQIRRMVEVIGSDIKKLKRIRIENIHLGDLKEGEYRRMTETERIGVLKRMGPEEK
ncbi:rRNA pseudouridine synthase [Candidatus Gracilibacteria bacterium]|nr:rRNA pseudouridine synthase [Candidatus Gracilibacteria bacterium]